MHFSFQAAGYTLSELLPLCRSSILQQRVLAINTLARIAQRGRQGEYTGVIEGSVVGRLLEAEVPLLLRYALDDSNDAVFYVAIHALHSLLVLMPEEVSKSECIIIASVVTTVYGKHPGKLCGQTVLASMHGHFPLCFSICSTTTFTVTMGTCYPA